jgi:hypothetical protein
MKKNPVYLMMAFAVSLMVIFSACKKENAKEPNTSDFTAQSDDHSQFAAETDAFTDDVNIAVEAQPAFNGRNTTVAICDATVAYDSNATSRFITITYNGTNCHGTRVRTGVVTASMPLATRWSDTGAALTITYENVKVVRSRDQKSILLNGSVTATNVSGGKLIHLANMGEIVHTLSSSALSVKFDDGSQHTWMVAKKRTFTYDNGVVISTEGTHTNNVAEWGVNRFGREFATSITEPLVIRQDCNFRLVSGKVEYKADINLAITFGLNLLGQPTTCPGTGSYYFKIEWPDLRNNMHSIIWPY